MQLNHAHVIITGGASGMGFATAKNFVSAGAKIAIFDINDDVAAAAVAELGPENAKYYRTDVTDTENVRKSIEAVIDDWGSIEVLINVAGMGSGMKIASSKGPHDLEVFKKVINLNLVALFDVTRQAAFAMRSNTPNEEGERGVIIHTSSIASMEGQMGQVAYAASKAGVNGMTLVIARDLADQGIRCCTIAPGTFDTPIMKGTPEHICEALRENTPFPKRFGKPSEYALLARMLVENPMMNGEVIRIDGAARMRAK